jgi:hypothetical protein
MQVPSQIPLSVRAIQLDPERIHIPLAATDIGLLRYTRFGEDQHLAEPEWVADGLPISRSFPDHLTDRPPDPGTNLSLSPLDSGLVHT